MNTQIYHITNGDALTERLSSIGIKGKIITMRECLIDGPKDTKNGWNSFFKSRKAFIYRQFGKELSYESYVIAQFTKMQEIPENASIHFWFEDDLFCQANFWFLSYFLKDKKVAKYLVRPTKESPYSFGHLSNSELKDRYNAKSALTGEEAVIWELYEKDATRYDEVSVKMMQQHPFIALAYQAHLDRLPQNESMGKPKEALLQLKNELGTDDFGNIYRKFTAQLPMYGYGDVQVLHMLKELEKE